jgi:hypothetical protein
MRLNPDRGDLEFESKIKQSLEASRVQKDSNAAAEISKPILSPTIAKKVKKSPKPAAPPAAPSPSKKAKTKGKKGFHQDADYFGQEREVAPGYGVGGHLLGGRDVSMEEVCANSLRPTEPYAHAGATKKRHGLEAVQKELDKVQKKWKQKKK